MNKAKTGVAADYGLKVVGIDSNLHLVLNESFLKVSDFRHAASILALQKLFGVYLNSASYEFEALKFVPENCSYYELLLMQCFETDCTVFYSSGGHTPRIMKLKQMEDFGPAQKYLHPCIYATRDNCGICGKCIRTQGGLFALGILDKFGDVFDLNAFEENKDTIFRQIIANRNNNKHCDEILQLLADSNDNFIQNMMRKEKTLNVVVTVAMRFQKQNKDKESKGEA